MATGGLRDVCLGTSVTKFFTHLSNLTGLVNTDFIYLKGDDTQYDDQHHQTRGYEWPKCNVSLIDEVLKPIAN